MSEPPILLQYEGEGDFRAVNTHAARLADRNYTVGEHYRMAPFADRSQASHNHFFAAVKDGFDNLPDDLRDDYPSPEHLRKKALIRCGYCDERSIVCSSNDEALRVAAFISPMDDYSIVSVADRVVRVWTAKSQSHRAMPKGEFQKSNDDVLDFIAGLLGVAPDELGKAA